MNSNLNFNITMVIKYFVWVFLPFCALFQLNLHRIGFKMEGLFYVKCFQEVAYTMHNINPSFNFETSYSPGPILPYFELKHTKQCCTISKGPGLRAISPGPHSVVCKFIHTAHIFNFGNVHL